MFSTAAPVPVYQRQYPRDRYPNAEQQHQIRNEHYRYQPREPVVQHYQQRGKQKGHDHEHGQGQGHDRQRKGFSAQLEEVANLGSTVLPHVIGHIWRAQIKLGYELLNCST